MTPFVSSFRALAAVACVVCSVASLAQTQTPYPSRPLRVIVPFAPGGSADVIGRIVMQRTGVELGQNMVIENRSGANSNIGIEIAANASADGYTVLYNTSSIIFNRFIYPKLGYDTFRDFAPVALTAVVPQVLVVIPSLPVRNLKEFIAHLRANPGKLDYASMGQGNIAHLTTALFLKMHKLDAVHVPYKGAPFAYADLIGGRTQFYFATITSAAPFVKDNRLRALAVTSFEPSAIVPGLPTMAEAGVPGYESQSRTALFAPAKTPPAVIARIHAEVARALNQPEVKERLFAAGLEVIASTPQEATAVIKSEMARMGRLIDEAGLRE